MTVFKRKMKGGQVIWRYDFWHQRERYFGECLNAKGERVQNKRDAELAEKVAFGEAASGTATRSKRRSRANGFTLLEAQTSIIKRVLDRQRKKSHTDNLNLWGDAAVAFFGVTTTFSELTQERVDEYVAHLTTSTVKRWLGGKHKPTKADMEDAALWRDTGRPLSKRQVNNYLRHLKKLLAIAEKVRDPVTKLPVLNQDPPLKVELERVPKRKPRPMPDSEFTARVAELPPWQQDLAWMSRLFGLRQGEGRRAEVRHVSDDMRGLFFPAGENKSGNDEFIPASAEGWKLLVRLRRQAAARGTPYLVTWPGFHAGQWWYYPWSQGEDVPAEAWQPMKGLGRAWRRSARRAGIAAPHRQHDVRARAITEVAKVNKAAARPFARHQHGSTTDLYIGVADDEVRQAVTAAMAGAPRMGRAPRRPKLRAVK